MTQQEDFRTSWYTRADKCLLHFFISCFQGPSPRPLQAPGTQELGFETSRPTDSALGITAYLHSPLTTPWSCWKSLGSPSVRVICLLTRSTIHRCTLMSTIHWAIFSVLRKESKTFLSSWSLTRGVGSSLRQILGQVGQPAEQGRCWHFWPKCPHWV